MGNFEGLRRRQTTLSTFTVPTAKMFTGDFSEILPGTVIYDPLTGQPFPGNVIPANRIDPVSQSLLEYYHSSTLPGLTNNYVQDNSQPFDRKGYVIRADFNESSSSQWMGRYNWGDDDAVEPGPRSGGFEDRHELQAVGRLEHPDAQLHAGQRRAVRLHQVLQLDRHPLGLYQRCGRRSEHPEPEIRRPGHVGHSERRVHRVQRTSVISPTARSPSTTTRCSSSTS